MYVDNTYGFKKMCVFFCMIEKCMRNECFFVVENTHAKCSTSSVTN